MSESRKRFHFQNAKNLTYNLELDLYKVQQVDKADFSAITDEKFTLANFSKETISLLLSNTSLLFAVIWVVVQDQVQEQFADGLTPISPKENQEAAQEEFVRSINGKVIEDARMAFIEALSDFFQDHQNALSILVGKLTKMKELVAQKMAEADPLMDQLMERELDKGIAELHRMLSETPGTQSTVSPSP
jgi:hypothetical protein